MSQGNTRPINRPNGICPVCLQPLVDNVEEHHITPVSYGGPQEGPTVFLHSDCHYNIHKTAESILGKTVKSKNYFGNEQLLKSAAPFIQAIIEAKRRYMEGETDIYKPRRKMIVVNLSDYEWRRIRKVAKDSGFSNTTKFIEEKLRSLTKF